MNKTQELFEILQELGLSIYQFSKETGIPKGRIYAWKDGKGKPKADDARVIESYLNKKGVRNKSDSQEVEPVLLREKSVIPRLSALTEVLLTAVVEVVSASSGENPAVIRKRFERAVDDLVKMG